MMRVTIQQLFPCDHYL